MDLNGVGAAQLKEILEQVEREEKAALTKVGLEFFTELVQKNTVKASESTDWHGFRQNGLAFTVDGVPYTATIVVTDVKQTEATREARKEAEKAAKEAAAQAAKIEKSLAEAQSNPEKLRALRDTLAKAGIQVSAPAAS